MLTMAKEGRVKAWEKGIAPVPEAEAGLLLDLEREIEKSMKDALVAAKGKKEIQLVRFKDRLQFEEKGPSMHPIPQFLAYKCHCALIVRLRTALRAMGKSVSVRYCE